jgi:hypothetical protein
MSRKKILLPLIKPHTHRQALALIIKSWFYQASPVVRALRPILAAARVSNAVSNAVLLFGY